MLQYTITHCKIRLSDVSQFVALNLIRTLNLIDNNGISLKTLQQNHNLFFIYRTQIFLLTDLPNGHFRDRALYVINTSTSN